jgi:2-polyprenyl-3-methyl-5-hydroxy-6-metoxy-1,4-benzoquinol methylase
MNDDRGGLYMEEVIRFEFGKNWQSYAKKSLTLARLAQFCSTFQSLLASIDLKNKKFIDIGYGQGLALVAAAEMGARVFGVDVDGDNIEALRKIQRLIDHTESIDVRIASILDDRFVETVIMLSGNMSALSFRQ